MTKSLQISLPDEQGKSYQVKFYSDRFANLADDLQSVYPGELKQIVIITDSNVGYIYLEELEDELGSLQCEVHSLTVGAGETSKNLHQVGQLCEQMSSRGVRRSGSLVLALGGGMIGDLAGFVASVYLRGIPFVQLPTSLLAMVDASIGGKTGVDTVNGKNLVGSFKQPLLVVAQIGCLHSLPIAEFRSGMAELVKHAFIADLGLLEQVEAVADQLGPNQCAAEMIMRSAAVKVNIVNQDVYEAGKRAYLNLGHTIGHALEHFTNYGLSHGEAVAVGMVLEAKISVQRGLLTEVEYDRMAAILEKLGLPTNLPENYRLDVKEIWTIMTKDKKNVADEIVCVLPRALGTDPEVAPVTLEEIKFALTG